VPAAEESLVGQQPSRKAFGDAADILLQGATGFAHNSFKIELARRAIMRALEQAAAGTPQSQSVKAIV
jgi:xanthine dehydrogenase YagS FAD-binding subunit